MITLARPSLLSMFVLMVVMSLSACNGSSSQLDSSSEMEVEDFPPMEDIDISDGPFLFNQNLYTSTVPTRIEFALRGGEFRTTSELSYSSSTRTLTEVSISTSGTTNFPVSERISKFNEFGQLISETWLSNGGVIQIANYEYVDGLLVREAIRSEVDGDIIQTRSLRYDGIGRLLATETIDPSTAEVLETASRVYAESGWVSTVISEGVTKKITTELNENQQVVRFTAVTTTDQGGLSRTTTQTFDENNQRLTRQRFGRGELLVETRYGDYQMIDGFIHDKQYRWNVFFNADAY